MNDRANEFRALQAGCLGMTYAAIEAAVERITEGLTRAELKALAGEVGLVLFTGESKGLWRRAFARRVIELKASGERCSRPFSA